MSRVDKVVWFLWPPKPEKDAPRLPRWGYKFLGKKIRWVWTGAQWVPFSGLGSPEDWSTAKDGTFVEVEK